MSQTGSSNTANDVVPFSISLQEIHIHAVVVVSVILGSQVNVYKVEARNWSSDVLFYITPCSSVIDSRSLEGEWYWVFTNIESCGAEYGPCYVILRICWFKGETNKATLWDKV